MSTIELYPARKAIFGREPAFWTGAVQTFLILVVAFGFPLSSDQVGVIVALINAAMGVFLAVLVRPINIAVFIGFAQAFLALLVTFGVGFSAEQVGALMAALGIFLNLIAVRPQVVPWATLKAGLTSVQPNLPPGV